MNRTQKKSGQELDKVRRLRRHLPALLFPALFAAFAITLITTMASNDLEPLRPRGIPPIVSESPAPPTSNKPAAAPTATPEGTPVSNMPPQTPATRVSVILGEKKELQVITGVDSFVMVSEEIAMAETTNRFTLNISGVKLGETILIVNSGQRRNTYIVAVVAKPLSAERANLASQIPVRKTPASTGTFTTTYSAGAGGTSALRQSVYFSHKLSDEKTLRAGGDVFKILGDGNRDLAFARVENYGLNRLSLGVDTRKRSIDVLDSEVNVSPLSLNNYTMRGFHMASRPGTGISNLPERGLEVFAGLARPSVSFYDNANGKIAGAMVPVFSTNSFRARAGMIAISPERNNRTAQGGSIYQVDAVFAPTSHFLAEAEAAYSNGNLSWRGKLDLKYAKYGGSAEVLHLARSSPFNSIGAQPGGRDSRSLSFYWRPTERFASTAGYNHTKVTRVANSVLADFDRSLFFAAASYNLGRGSRINIRYTDQTIETAFPRALSKFQIETRTFLAGYNQRFGRKWSNTLEGRLNFSREANASEGLEKGFSISEQLRYNWHGGSVAGFVNYTHKSPSLTSLIVRNPQLLPPALQTAFALDPAEFIRVNRDRISTLLNGVELPQTRSLDTGVRAQKSVSRFVTVQAEARYNAGEILAVNQKNLYLSTSVGIKIDNANSLQVSAWKAVGGRNDAGLTVSYTHQLGASGGDGFQFSRLFNFERGKVHGRVFYDLNGNGRPDPGEQGASGMKIQIDGKRSVVTDKDGRYELSADEGRHKVVMSSGELGVHLLANTPTENIVDLDAGQRLILNFGVRDFGTVSGKIFNDALQGKSAPGLGGVRVFLRSVNVGNGGFVLQGMTNGNGAYEFSNLRPGAYTVEIDTATLPADFRIPEATVFAVNVEALRSSYFDIPVAAQRAVAGTVFVDRNGDGKYTAGVDMPVQGAYVTLGEKAVMSDANGAYLFRDLKSGRAEVVGRSPQGGLGMPVTLDLTVDPVTRRAVDIPLER